MRLFTAIDLPADIQSPVGEVLKRLRDAGSTDQAKLSWSTIEKLHVTTKFIGEWPEERLAE